jgi:uncharacterized repeat protein (TIGR01451 family)
LALAIVLLTSIAASAEDPCGKEADLWFPAPGVVLSGGAVSVQEISGDVCQGGTVTITVTVDNLSCGDAGPFDVTVYWDSTSHKIQTKHVDNLVGCDHIVLTFSCKTTGIPPGEHTIIVVADSGSTVHELNEGNNQITFDVFVRPNEPMIEATKTYVDTDGGEVNPGDTIRYEIVITNEGCAPMPNTAGHEFTDTLPGLLTATGFVQASSGTISVSGSEVVWDGSIPAGGSVHLTVKAKIDNDVEEGTGICNQGFVHWDSDEDGSSDATEPTDDPGTPADDDPTCFVVHVPTAPIPVTGTIDAPSLTEWGMIVLSILLATAFWWRLRRRSVSA